MTKNVPSKLFQIGNVTLHLGITSCYLNPGNNFFSEIYPRDNLSVTCPFGTVYSNIKEQRLVRNPPGGDDS